MNVYAFRDRFRDPEPVDDNFAGLSCVIDIVDELVYVGQRPFAYVTGEAHITGRADGEFDIDVLLCQDARTGAFFKVDKRSLDPIESEIARALEAKVEKVATDRLREML